MEISASVIPSVGNESWVRAREGPPVAVARPDEARQRARELLRLINMERERDQLTGTLSGGQKQKIAIARALGNLPELLLADEPTGNLDSGSTREVLEVLQSINRSRTLTTIMVTHDPQAAAFAERRLVLEQGRLREEGHDSNR